MFLYKNRSAGLLAAGAFLCIFTACKTLTGAGQPALTDENTYRLTAVSEDKTYGYIVENPVKVGNGTEADGPQNERRFLNALTGPGGEKVHYRKSGRCCFFKTKAVTDGYGRLTKYRVTHEGRPDTVTLFLNMYDSGKMKAPQGFGYKK